MEIEKLSINQRNILKLFDRQENWSVGQVSRALNIPHPTAKQSLGRLRSYNLIGRQGIGKGTFYFRKDENVIVDTLGNKLVTVYQGKSAFTGLFYELREKLKKGDFYWSFAFREECQEAEMRQFFANFHDELTHNEVEDKTIVHESVIDDVRKTYVNVHDLQVKMIDQDVPTGMIIMKEAVANLVWGDEPIAIVTYAPQVVKRYQEFFKEMWGKAK